MINKSEKSGEQLFKELGYQKISNACYESRDFFWKDSENWVDMFEMESFTHVIFKENNQNITMSDELATAIYYYEKDKTAVHFN